MAAGGAFATPNGMCSQRLDYISQPLRACIRVSRASEIKLRCPSTVHARNWGRSSPTYIHPMRSGACVAETVGAAKETRTAAQLQGRAKTEGNPFGLWVHVLKH